MSAIMISLLAGLGVSAWVYNKMQHNNGGQTNNSLIVAVAAGIAAAVLIIVLLEMFLPD